MVKKELPKRVFRRGKKPLGKTSGKIREKRIEDKADVAIVSGSTTQFPNINRLIAEWKKEYPQYLKKGKQYLSLTKKHTLAAPWMKYVWIAGIVVGVGLLAWESVVFMRVYPQVVAQAKQRKVLEARLATWESLAVKYPQYRDGHFEAALLAYRLGRLDIMQTELKKVLEIDPNYAFANQMEGK